WNSCRATDPFLSFFCSHEKCKDVLTVVPRVDILREDVEIAFRPRIPSCSRRSFFILSLLERLGQARDSPRCSLGADCTGMRPSPRSTFAHPLREPITHVGCRP